MKIIKFVARIRLYRASFVDEIFNTPIMNPLKRKLDASDEVEKTDNDITSDTVSVGIMQIIR